MRSVFAWRTELDAALRQSREWSEVARSAMAEMAKLAERYESQLRSAHERYEREMVRQEARYADLLQRYTALRLRGFDDPKPIPVAVEKPPVDPVIEAVDAVSARFDPKVRAEMLRQVAVDRKLEIPDDEIIARIHRGYRPSDEIQ